MAAPSKTSYVSPKERIKQYKLNHEIANSELKKCAASVCATGRLHCYACKNTWSTNSTVLVSLRSASALVFGQRCKKCVAAYIKPQFKDADWERMLDEAYVFLSKHETDVVPTERKPRGKCKSAHRADLCEHCEWRDAQQGDADIDDLTAAVEKAAIAATASN